MGQPQPEPKLMTEAEYLAFERAALDERHFFVDGEIFAMSGETRKHGRVSVNLIALIVAKLKGGPCEAFGKEMRVRSGPIAAATKNMRGMYSYPDVVVVCGEPEVLDEAEDVLLNPKAVFEVLSPSTEAFDRGGKFTRYQTYNPTLTDYVLVAQDEPQIEHYRLQPDGSWAYRRYADLDAEVVVESIDVTLKLADVYDRVKFPKK